MITDHLPCTGPGSRPWNTEEKKVGQIPALLELTETKHENKTLLLDCENVL